MFATDSLAARQVMLDDAQQGLALLSELSLTDHWQPDERAALADEQDAVADASDVVADAFDHRAAIRDDDANSRQIKAWSRGEAAIAVDPSLEPGLYLRYKSARDLEATRADRADAATDRARSAMNREIAAQSRHQAASDRDQAAMDRARAGEATPHG